MGRRRDAKWQATSWFSPDAEFEVKSTSTNPNGRDANWSPTAQISRPRP
jgi:hypothetical protein